ncbi:FAD-dependent oxidoreductase [Nakamurella sp. YIM 132087]|uniref:FAD-dependent oxidoreductase n=1 Tax=Nakamurella alba TaxID=2665158 RepID=A0A7K1FIG5_9ACTN|nr:FAD-dependent oxidoreductase [Nakamurella alba]MTD13911.1 FAD-dependent oxidoreductase [Nakamurella alba]
MHIVVVGGGVIGLTTAYHLAREGEQVTVLDARAAGRGASEVNAGWVVPAEATPVPGPGMVLQSMKWMLHRDSPLYIRPSLHPSFLRFMTGMWRHSNARDQRAGFEGHLRLAQATVEVFDEYRADGMDFEMHNAGLLMAFTDPANLHHHLDNLDLVRRYGLDPQVLMDDDVRGYEPHLSDAVRGGIRFPLERHVDPEALVRALAGRLATMGARVVEHAKVDGVVRDGHRITAVRSGDRRFPADRFVLAAGAWTGPVSRLFGAPLPIRPGKGYSVDLAPFGLRGPVNLSDSKVAVTPLDDRLRLAGTMEFGGLDERVNQVRVDAILRAPGRYFRDWSPPSETPVARAGCRPMTPDGLPVIGRLPGTGNAFVSSGHGMLGVTLAPGTALALADLVLHDITPEQLQPFSPTRFRRGGRTPTNRLRKEPA